MNVAIGQQNVGDALENAVRNVVVDTMGGYAAGQIGKEYHFEMIDGVTHKILHALSGGAIGALFNPDDPLKGALSGAAANFMSESLAEAMGPDFQGPLNTADFSRISTALASYLMNLDVGTAIHTSTLAVENNYLAAGAALVRAMEAAKIAWEAYALTHPEEIESAKESICEVIADKTGLPIETVQKIGDNVLNVMSVGSAVKQGGKYVLKKGTVQIAKEGSVQLHKHKGENHLLPTPLSRDARTYIHDMQQRSNLPIASKQRNLLQEALENKKFDKLYDTEKAKHYDVFNKKSVKKDLIKQWEEETGQVWPTFDKKNKITGNMEKVDAQIHHIIPQQVGGPHEWWNVHPLEGGKPHQGGVHGTGSALNKILKDHK